MKPTRFAAFELVGCCCELAGDASVGEPKVALGVGAPLKALSTSLLSSRKLMASPTAEEMSRGGVGGRVGSDLNTVELEDNMIRS